jgi:hypothetical protein
MFLQRRCSKRPHSHIDGRPQGAIGFCEFCRSISHELDRAGRQCRPACGAGMEIEQEISQFAQGRIGPDSRVDVETGRRENKPGRG